LKEQGQQEGPVGRKKGDLREEKVHSEKVGSKHHRKQCEEDQSGRAKQRVD